MHHYITEYWRDGRHWAEAWVQVNVFGRRLRFWRRRAEASDERPAVHGTDVRGEVRYYLEEILQKSAL